MNYNLYMVSRWVSSPTLKMVPPFVASPTHMMTLNFHVYKYDNYGQAPYIVSSYTQSFQANLFTRLFTCPSDQINSPSLPSNTNKYLLKSTFSEGLSHN